MDYVTMEDVIDALGLEQEFPIRGRQGNYTCPVCNGKRKLNINFQKNVFRCNKCDDFKGNAMDFWAYYRKLPYGTSNTRKEAVRDYLKETKTGSLPKVKNKPKSSFIPPKETPIAELKYRDATYRELLAQLSLEKKHMTNLIQGRGLTEEAVKRYGYKSAPRIGTNIYSENILNKGMVLEGVPGFYISKGTWKFVSYGSGFLIPVRDIDGRIKGLQIRHDSGDTRYRTISSDGKEMGTKGKTFPHFSQGNGDFSEVILTEGPLKADIISHFTGYPVIGVLGVNCLNDLPEMLNELRKRSCRKIMIAYDMDMHSNTNVKKAFNKLKGIIRSARLNQTTLMWDDNIKGLDDWLFLQSKL